MKRRRSLKQSAGAAIVGAVLIGVAAGCAATPGSPGAGQAAAAPPVVTVKRADIQSTVVATGQLVANPSYTVLSTSAGTVGGKPPAAGSKVESGDTAAMVAGKAVTFPSSGTVEAMLQGAGDQVGAGVPLQRVRYGGFGISISVAPENAYRAATGPVSAVANINGGPSGVSCTLVTPAATTGTTTEAAQPTPEDSAPAPYLCLLPLDAKVVPGLVARVGLHLEVRKAVLNLPVVAVSGFAQQGVATRMVDGKAVETKVELGVSDGVNIEIRGGLNEGDAVLGTAPGLR